MVLLFQFWPLDRDVDNVFFWPISKFGWNQLLGKSLFPKACIVIFNVNNHLPSDIRCFLGEIKCWTKSKVTPQIMLLLNSTFYCWKRHTPNKTWYRSFLIILNSFEWEFVLIISLVLFISQKTRSTSFCPQYISFKMNGLMGKLDNLTYHNNPNTKWVRFRGTPCIMNICKESAEKCYFWITLD